MTHIRVDLVDHPNYTVAYFTVPKLRGQEVFAEHMLADTVMSAEDVLRELAIKGVTALLRECPVVMGERASWPMDAVPEDSESENS